MSLKNWSKKLQSLKLRERNKIFNIIIPAKFPWRTSTDQGLTLMGMGRWCRWRATMVLLDLMILGATALPMHNHKWILRTWSWRKEKALLGLLPWPSLGAFLILSFRGGRGLPAIRCILWKAKSRAPSGRASDGLSISIPRLFTAGRDLISRVLLLISIFCLYLKFLFTNFNVVFMRNLNSGSSHLSCVLIFFLIFFLRFSD